MGLPPLGDDYRPTLLLGFSLSEGLPLCCSADKISPLGDDYGPSAVGIPPLRVQSLQVSLMGSPQLENNNTNSLGHSARSTLLPHFTPACSDKCESRGGICSVQNLASIRIVTPVLRRKNTRGCSEAPSEPPPF